MPRRRPSSQQSADTQLKAVLPTGVIDTEALSEPFNAFTKDLAIDLEARTIYDLICGGYCAVRDADHFQFVYLGYYAKLSHFQAENGDDDAGDLDDLPIKYMCRQTFGIHDPDLRLYYPSEFGGFHVFRTWHYFSEWSGDNLEELAEHAATPRGA